MQPSIAPATGMGLAVQRADMLHAAPTFMLDYFVVRQSM